MSATVDRSRPGTTLVVAALLATALVSGLAALSPRGGPGAPAVPASTTVEGYLAAVEGLAHDGGRIVQQGMKPGITDLTSGDLDGDLAVDSARAWARQMRQVAAAWQALTPPPTALADAHGRFLAALDRYVGVAAVLEEAARVPVDQRGPFLDLAASEGEAADDTFDRAAALVQTHLRSRGRAPVTWLPDPAPADR